MFLTCFTVPCLKHKLSKVKYVPNPQGACKSSKHLQISTYAPPLPGMGWGFEANVVTWSTNWPLTGGSVGHSWELYESIVLKYVVLMLSSLYLFGLNKIGLLPFYKHGFLKLHLVFSGCRVQDLEAIRALMWRSVGWFHQHNKHYNLHTKIYRPHACVAPQGKHLSH